jgi:PAS domain-containing protein
MQRFMLQPNVALFQAALKAEEDDAVRRTIRDMLGGAQRELALLEAALFGVQPGPRRTLGVPGDGARNRSLGTLLRDKFEQSQRPYLLLHPGSGLHIVDLNDAYARATMISRAAVVGRPIFEVFPDNPNYSGADGVHNLYASLRAAAESGQPDAMPIQRYDVRDSEGRFVERHWRPVNTPLLDDGGSVAYLLHHVEDVTDEVAAGGSDALRRR